MYLIKATVPNNYYSVLKLNFNILILVLLLIKATINLLKLFIHLLFYLYKSSIYFLFHLCKLFIYLLLYFYKSFIYLFKLFVYFIKLRSNKLILVEKFLLYSLIINVKYLIKNYKTLINIFK